MDQKYLRPGNGNIFGPPRDPAGAGRAGSLVTNRPLFDADRGSRQQTGTVPLPPDNRNRTVGRKRGLATAARHPARPITGPPRST